MIKNIGIKIILVVIVGITLTFLMQKAGNNNEESLSTPQPVKRTWQIKSVDTMKYSRDLSAEKINDPSFDNVIGLQVKAIKEVSASHIAIATPYDERFVPMWKRWVMSARKEKLNVWFRGNFSGWEGWFGQGRNSINREDHIRLTRAFIANNPDLFKDGDVFSPCPECENGGPGDPRNAADIQAYRKFLIDERNASLEEFEKINKKVTVLDSMNFDVAKLVMDKQTAQAMGNIIVIDHYVKTPEKLSEDVDFLHQRTGANIFLGEFGAPIPDIHGKLSAEEQAAWIDKSLNLLKPKEHVIGLSYWVGVGGSTAIFNDDLSPKPAAQILEKFFKLDDLD